MGRLNEVGRVTKCFKIFHPDKTCDFFTSCAAGVIREMRARQLILAKKNWGDLSPEEKDQTLFLLEGFRKSDIEYIESVCKKNARNKQNCPHFILTICDGEEKSGPRAEMYLKPA